MASYLEALNQAQNGWETNWGVAANATAKLMGVKDIKLDPAVDVMLHQDMRGSLAEGYAASMQRIGGKGSVEMDASYEDIHYPLEWLFGTVVPTGTTAPYTRDYAAPLTAVLTPRKATLVYGQTSAVQALVGAIGTKLVLSGSIGEPMSAKIDLAGKQVSAGTLQALNDRTVNFAMGDHAALYIDTWAGTIGTTAINAAFWAWELTIDARREDHRFLGSLTPGEILERNKWTGTLKLSLEFTSDTDDYLADTLTASAVQQKQIRIKYSTGAGASAKQIQLDFCGTELAAPQWGNAREGVVTFDYILTGTYHTTVANWLKIQTKCATASIV